MIAIIGVAAGTGKLFSVRDIPTHDLIFGAGENNPDLNKVVDQLEQASGAIIVTPIYKAAYSGALKALLDLLPQQAFAGKVVLPIATGGSQKHLLAIAYALKPVLYALGAIHVLSGLYVSDDQIKKDGSGHLILNDGLASRLGTHKLIR
ncbi:MAG: NAD(P)H-dependent oxidoreductase [Methylobacter sp.]|nr:NAD(P)H-dependent oxidoreductase [Methylobacter sp.]